MYSVPRMHISSFILRTRRPKPEKSSGSSSYRPGGTCSPGCHRNEILSSFVDETTSDKRVVGLKTLDANANATADYIDEMARKYCRSRVLVGAELENVEDPSRSNVYWWIGESCGDEHHPRHLNPMECRTCIEQLTMIALS